MYINVQTNYSLLQSTLRVEDYVNKGVMEGVSYLGICDLNTLMGVVDFYQSCQKAGIKPLIGMTVHLSQISKPSKDIHLLLFAKSFKGYQQLIQISYLVSQGPDQIDSIWHYLKETPLELVMISPGQDGVLEQAILDQDLQLADQHLAYFRDIFGSDNVYLGLSAFPYNQEVTKKLADYAQSRQVRLVSNQPVKMLHENEGFALKVLAAIADNQVIDMSLFDMVSYHYLYSQKELKQMYELMDLGHIMEETDRLADSLTVTLPLHQNYLPCFHLIPEGRDSSSYLQTLTMKSLVDKGLDQNPIYLDRLRHELSVINQMGFADYFLIVWEMMDYCHQSGIRTGPGRGSAAGSLVSYLLAITLVDPIAHDLLFERFLNPERMTMPDIDFDVPDNKRDQVIQHLVQVYGPDRVAQIATLGTFGAKQAIRDSLRVLGFGTNILKEWASAIPNDPAMTLKKAYQESARLQQLVDRSVDNRRIFTIACQIEGTFRHVSTHAAGVIIHDQPLNQVIPVSHRLDSPLLSQLTMYDLEAVGLLKLDILGLKNLTLLENTLQTIQKTQGELVDVQAIPRNDAETLRLFRRGLTNGVFQFESDGIKRVLKRLGPTNFDDIVAVNALFRPGPMKQIDAFIKRKKGQVKVEDLHPLIAPILKSTYGIIVYQEQVMQIVQVMAGYSLGQADLLRRAMGKKQVQVMASERDHFIQGAKAKGIESQVAGQVFELIAAFAMYGFNKAHAVVYSTLAYQLAYLKAHYPLAFYVTLLNQGSSGTQTMEAYIKEVKHVLGPILSLDINRSLASFSIDGANIRLGFESVKGLRRDLIQHILKDRAQLGDYEDFQSFVSRLPKKWINADVLEPLILLGAFDKLGYNRATLYYNLPKFIQSAEFSGLSMPLFDDLKPNIEVHQEFEPTIKLKQEIDLLGYSIQAHPLHAYKDLIAKFDDLDSLEDLPLRKNIKVVAYLADVRLIETKKGDPMAFVKLDSGAKIYNGVAFPETFLRYQALIKPRIVVYLEGQVSQDKRQERQVIIHRMQAVTQENQSKMKNASISQCFIRLQAQVDLEAAMDFIKTQAQDFPGPCKVYLVSPDRKVKQLEDSYKLGYGQTVQDRLIQYFGLDNVVFQ